MSERSNALDAAAPVDGKSETHAGHAADRADALSEEVRSQQEALMAWSAVGAISNAVGRVSDDFARRGAGFVFVKKPSIEPSVVNFEIRRNGSIKPDAWLNFALFKDGIVAASTSAPGVRLPGSLPVTEVTQEWAEQAAEQVLFAVLGDRRMPVPGNDSIDEVFERQALFHAIDFGRA